MEIENKNEIYKVLLTLNALKIIVSLFYIYIPKIPVIITINKRFNLKYVNGAKFKSIGVIPDL